MPRRAPARGAARARSREPRERGARTLHSSFKTCLGQNVAQQTANRTQRQRGGFISVTSNLRSSACKIGAPAQKKRPGPRVSTSQNCERASWPRSNALARVLLLRGCPPCEQGRQALSPDCRGVGPCRATVGLIDRTLMSSVGECRGLLSWAVGGSLTVTWRYAPWSTRLVGF